MIRNLITSTVLILAALDVPAQTTGKHEIQIGVGLHSDEAVIPHMLENFVNVLFGWSPTSIEPKTFLNISYRYRLKPKFSLGVTTGYRSRTYDKKHDRSGTYGYKTKSAVMAFECVFHHYHKPNIAVYSLAGLGSYFTQDQSIIYPDQTYSDAAMTFQATPLGIRFGKTVGVFAELGYGYKGILNFGISGKF